jgi:hypothetical protein
MKTKLLLLCAAVFFVQSAWAETTLDMESAVKMALEKKPVMGHILLYGIWGLP